ncbi:MAG: arylsulfatase [Bacteroidales bacterium]|nr:arylsulfatase [Bacteroidales bacterium]
MLASLLPAQSKQKPNIVFILCDDMGYGDLGVYGQKYIETPNLDKMAKQGMLFTQAYSGSPVSAPSRATMMTGQHTGKTHIRDNKEYWSGEVQYGVCTDYAVAGQEPLDPNRMIVPEIMKANGYTTGMFGKWAAGYEGSVSTPDLRGVDEYYGYICQYQAHLYYPNFINKFSKKDGDKEVKRIELTENTQYPMYGDGYEKRPQYTGDMIHQEAMKFLNDQTKDQPFYALLTYTLPHAELYQPNDSILQYYTEKFTDDTSYGGSDGKNFYINGTRTSGVGGSRYNPNLGRHAQFAAMITRLDIYVGEVLELLDKKGLSDNTIVIFTSDNGPHEEGGADPAYFGRDGKLRGVKRDVYEGGFRVPFIAKWPGVIKENSVSDHICAFWDIMPTFTDIAGGKISDYVDSTDGISFLPTLTGKGKQKKHDFLYWEFQGKYAVRKGDWKLIYKLQPSKVKGVKPEMGYELYNLATDLHEDNNLIDNPKYKKIADKLKKIMKDEHHPNYTFETKYNKN